MSTAGLQYSFGTYSGTVRDALGLTQKQLVVLAFGKDVGAYLGVYTGVFYDRFGPRSTLVVGVRAPVRAPMSALSHPAGRAQGLLMLLGYLGLYALTGMGPGKHPGARCAGKTPPATRTLPDTRPLPCPGAGPPSSSSSWPATAARSWTWRA